MSAKRKAKTEVMYDVEWIFGTKQHAIHSLSFTNRFRALQYARTEAQYSGVNHRVVRVERTVVAEVKP